MKCFFIYAMMAGGILASCSQSENDDLLQDVTGGSEVQSAEKISLSASSPNVGVDVQTRAGSVGADQNTLTGIGWQQETVYIYACLKEPNGQGILRIGEDNEPKYMLKDVEAYIKTTDSENVIEWGKPNGTASIQYYNREGAYAFFGCHIGEGITHKEWKEADGVYGWELGIDGTQDLMNATAGVNGITGLGDKHQAFSAYSARNNVKPNLVFQHQLTRFTFKAVRGGDEAEQKKAEKVCVENVQVESFEKVFLPVVYNCYDESGAASAKEIRLLDNDVKTNGTLLTLQDRDENRVMHPLDKSKYYLTEEKQIGEALMFYPTNRETVNVKITLYQEEDSNGNAIPDNGQRTQVINKPVSAPEGGFLPGRSYNLIITVYSVQDVRITATLEEWKDGGDIPVNPNEFEDEK